MWLSGSWDCCRSSGSGMSWSHRRVEPCCSISCHNGQVPAAASHARLKRILPNGIICAGPSSTADADLQAANDLQHSRPSGPGSTELPPSAAFSSAAKPSKPELGAGPQQPHTSSSSQPAQMPAADLSQDASRKPSEGAEPAQSTMGSSEATGAALDALGHDSAAAASDQGPDGVSVEGLPVVSDQNGQWYAWQDGSYQLVA